jgi:hypothetical protein
MKNQLFAINSDVDDYETIVGDCGRYRVLGHEIAILDCHKCDGNVMHLPVMRGVCPDGGAIVNDRDEHTINLCAI